MNILFLDIETSQEYEHFKDMPEDGQKAFLKKFKSKVDASEGKLTIEDVYRDEAALYAEFSRIVCISVGTIMSVDAEPTVMCKAYIGTEVEIFEKLFTALDKLQVTNVCAHNGNAFDFPFLVRRLMINRYPIPGVFLTAGKKPWEMSWIDTNELWQCLDKRHYTSLITLCYVFKIPSPKVDMEGKDVPAAFHRGEIQRIATYCNLDVFALVNVYNAIKKKDIITKVKYAIA
jgi:3'-5' exonuclease